MKNLLFVVVLYRMTISESETVCSLLRNSAILESQGIATLVVDNSPDVLPIVTTITHGIEYRSFGKNKGLAGAYQSCLLLAKERGFRFIALFDQDSEIEESFLDKLVDVSAEQGADVAVWCPDVFSGGTPVSPYSVNRLGWPSFRPAQSANLYGINSFSVVSVAFLESIGGFDQFYWLDSLDSWLYEKAHRGGWRVDRLNVRVKHDLSLVSGKISLSRMMNIAFYESCFAAEYGRPGRVAGTVLRLILRGAKRRRIFGGFFNYGRYLREIGRGFIAGLRRRHHAHALSQSKADGA
jgi:glycosyltransferase involved in cell wall biosynthesis